MPANTPHGVPYPLPSEPVAAGAQAIRNVAEWVDANTGHYRGRLLAANWPPANPHNGDVAEFVADDANAVIWQFRYNANSASPYKWEFVGGAPLAAQDMVARTGSLTVSTWGTFSGDPPLTIPRAGDYLVDLSAALLMSASGTTWMGVLVGSTNPTVDANTAAIFCSANGARGSARLKQRLNGQAAAVVLNPRWQASVTGNVTRSGLYFDLTPVRIA